MLDEQQLGDYIDRHFASTLFRLETLDRYDVGSNGDDLDRYLAGEPGPDMARKGPWMDHIRSEVARGLHTYRVHVVRGPLTATSGSNSSGDMHTTPPLASTSGSSTSPSSRNRPPWRTRTSG